MKDTIRDLSTDPRPARLLLAGLLLWLPVATSAEQVPTMITLGEELAGRRKKLFLQTPHPALGIRRIAKNQIKRSVCLQQFCPLF